MAGLVKRFRKQPYVVGSYPDIRSDKQVREA
jgi:hypothetical protein